MNLDFFKNRSIFITGHTGFKGSWLCRILQLAGANITGYALAPVSGGAYRDIVDESAIASHIGDVRDYDALSAAFEEAKPEMVFHLAAQPLVLDSYEQPAYTFDTNVMGTVNLLEAVRHHSTVRSVVVVTTDKVYRNNEWIYGYRENDTLGGSDPYSVSKACAELAAGIYGDAFLRPKGTALSTVRAGNVIGGGDNAANRIIPDCIRGAVTGKPIIVRNPNSIRPYQHVLEPLFAYLTIAQKQFENPEFADSYNIGPKDIDCVTTDELVSMFCEIWGNGQAYGNVSNTNSPRESELLKLDCSKMLAAFGWRPLWYIRTAVAKTVDWAKSDDKRMITDSQIREYAEAFAR
jgi:CDP-glucose 4,6-dehydratase